jgi:hypothetical protein
VKVVVTGVVVAAAIRVATAVAKAAVKRRAKGAVKGKAKHAAKVAARPRPKAAAVNRARIAVLRDGVGAKAAVKAVVNPVAKKDAVTKVAPSRASSRHARNGRAPTSSNLDWKRCRPRTAPPPERKRVKAVDVAVAVVVDATAVNVVNALIVPRRTPRRPR